MKLTRLLSDMLVNDSRIILLSGHVSATNRYTDPELVAELLHQRDRSVSQKLVRALFRFKQLLLPWPSLTQKKISNFANLFTHHNHHLPS